LLALLDGFQSIPDAFDAAREHSRMTQVKNTACRAGNSSQSADCRYIFMSEVMRSNIGMDRISRCLAGMPPSTPLLHQLIGHPGPDALRTAGGRPRINPEVSS